MVSFTKQERTFLHLLKNRLNFSLHFSGNAIKNAETPVMDALEKGEYTTLDASGIQPHDTN